MSVTVLPGNRFDSPVGKLRSPLAAQPRCLRALRNAGIGLSVLSAIAGCATEAIERQQISKLAIRESHSGLSAKLIAPEGSGSGLFRGALAGLLYGVVNPETWLIGGPIVMAPIGAMSMAACGAAVSEVEKPSVKLQNIASEVGLSEFHAQLRSTLQRMGKSTSMLEDAPSPERSTDAILDVSEISVELKGDVSDSPEGLVCRPNLSASGQWKLTSATDGRELQKKRASKYERGVSDGSFKDWFADSDRARDDVRTVLAGLAKEICWDLFPRRVGQKSEQSLPKAKWLGHTEIYLYQSTVFVSYTDLYDPAIAKSGGAGNKSLVSLTTKGRLLVEPYDADLEFQALDIVSVFAFSKTFGTLVLTGRQSQGKEMVVYIQPRNQTRFYDEVTKTLRVRTIEPPVQ